MRNPGHSYAPHSLRFGPALELVTARTVAAGATFTAATFNSGNLASVRNADETRPVAILQVWSDHQAAGTFRIRSPRMHDNVQGIRYDTVIGDLKPLLPWGVGQSVYPQDTLTVEILGSATAGDVETVGFLVYYDDIAGINAQLATWNDIRGRIRNLVTVENTLALGTGGDYSGEEAISAEFDLLKADTLYALLGYTTDTECAAVRWRGADTGNFGVGGPGEPDIKDITKDWFILLSTAFDLPLIPVFNSSNKSGILLDGVQDENGADPTITSIFAELY